MLSNDDIVLKILRSVDRYVTLEEVIRKTGLTRYTVKDILYRLFLEGKVTSSAPGYYEPTEKIG